jgi:hydrogenase/urease accessory protein HupE
MHILDAMLSINKKSEMKYIKIFLSIALLILVSGAAYAHGVDEDTQTFLSGNSGVAFVPFLYIGAKHMLTGYDHLLFLVGVIFFCIAQKKYCFM